ncbi:hypothetical protein TrVE_jg11392 [Triparma verrucosa]|uniref:Cyclin-like domain-containing protein n=1 Tax=Triparma verrucosa TaxID=1606542 RepID=A0A9W7ENF6_9STRA|nr:hypothetical protein TrVE_jg11392 [Triparma verrucosa]
MLENLKEERRPQIFSYLSKSFTSYNIGDELVRGKRNKVREVQDSAGRWDRKFLIWSAPTSLPLVSIGFFPLFSLQELVGIFASIRDGEAAYQIPASLDKEVGLDQRWRNKLVDWSYQVVDHYGYPREAVAISMNILDRFSANAGLNKKLHQLAALATLHLALKSGGNAVRLQDLVALSRGYFSSEQVIYTESKVLEAVNWRVHPTMAAAIIPYFFLLLPEPSRTPAEQDGSVYEQETIEMDADLPQIMSDYAIFLTELAVSDSTLVAYDEVSIALAATMISLFNHPVSDEQCNEFVKAVARVARLDVNAKSVMACQQKLHSLALAYHNEEEQEEEANKALGTVSPQTGAPQPYRDSASPYGVENFQMSPKNHMSGHAASSLKRQRVCSIGDSTEIVNSILNDPDRSDDMIH